MDELKSAISLLESELDLLGTPSPGTPLWYVMQAKSFGLTMLRTALARGMIEPTTLNMFRANSRRTLQLVEVSQVNAVPGSPLPSAVGVDVGVDLAVARPLPIPEQSAR